MRVRFPSTIALACIVIVGGVDYRSEPIAVAARGEGSLPSVSMKDDWRTVFPQ
jgi:hypothetical protein